MGGRSAALLAVAAADLVGVADAVAKPCQQQQVQAERSRNYSQAPPEYITAAQAWVVNPGDGNLLTVAKCPHLGCRVPFCGPAASVPLPRVGVQHRRRVHQGPALRGMDRYRSPERRLVRRHHQDRADRTGSCLPSDSKVRPAGGVTCPSTITKNAILDPHGSAQPRSTPPGAGLHGCPRRFVRCTSGVNRGCGPKPAAPRSSTTARVRVFATRRDLPR